MNERAIQKRIREQAVARRPLACASGCHLCLFLCLVVGCNKPATTAVVPVKPPANGGPAVGGGGEEVGKGEGASGRNTILQLPFDQAAKLVMLNIGRAYQIAMASDGKPPKNADDLGAGKLKTLRDMQDHEVEVVYGVDVRKLGEEAANTAIAWEKTPTNDGYRMVLMADFVTVKYVATAEFEKMKKAK